MAAGTVGLRTGDWGRWETGGTGGLGDWGTGDWGDWRAGELGAGDWGAGGQRAGGLGNWGPGSWSAGEEGKAVRSHSGTDCLEQLVPKRLGEDSDNSKLRWRDGKWESPNY